MIFSYYVFVLTTVCHVINVQLALPHVPPLPIATSALRKKRPVQKEKENGKREKESKTRNIRVDNKNNVHGKR